MPIHHHHLPLLLLLLFISSPTSATPLHAPGLDAFLLTQSVLDPSASKDTFPTLPKPLKHHLLSSPLPSPLLPSLLSSLSLSIPLKIILVGPSFLPSSPSLLRSFLSSALISSLFHSHHLPPLSVSHSLSLDPSLSLPPLSSRLSDALLSSLSSSPTPLHLSSLHPVPFSVVDDIVSDHHSSLSDPNSFYLYLISLPRPPRAYAYSYSSARRDPSPAFSECLGTLYTSDRRYLWVDLTAGPVNYGPALSGDGLLPRGESHPLASLQHDRPRSERSVIADVSSLVVSAYNSLLVPSLRVPVYYDNTLTVQFVHVYGGSGRPDSSGLDFGSIEKTIRDGGLLLEGQNLKFETRNVKFEDCVICTYAVSRSMTSYTSRFLFENYTLIVSEYLDSKKLHHVLLESADEVRRSVGLSTPASAEEDEELAVLGRTLPVYVFDVDFDRMLLLDRYHQAVAFRDMVVAVRTKSVQTVSDYSCNGRHVLVQARNLERPIVGAVLQSLWGVSPTHLTWSPQHNHTTVDYTWSVGRTPFGPFSDSISVSFVQRDAAKRNVLLTSLNASVTSAIDVVGSMDGHGGDRKLLSRKNRYIEFVQRWNLFKYKIDRVVSAMSRLDYDRALYFLRSSDHDLFAMHTLVYEASQELESSLVCFEDPPIPWVSVSLFGVVAVTFLYVVSKRDRIFKNKRKQF
ncbi:hypothetical protein QJS04_geneDACA017846 [Acorus gramineus]|uniref:DUF7906 domain-containing protein n=1 Tax=Acorus gramineus TaxID=55184 RepID=A0AAV9ALW8_ACOGR|nr:hypothetical protein QJS04_geneDACA017846 [Acorus gramineus]